MNRESVFDCLLTVSQVHLLLLHSKITPLVAKTTSPKLPSPGSGAHRKLTVTTDKHREIRLSTIRNHEAGMIPVIWTLWKRAPLYHRCYVTPTSTSFPSKTCYSPCSLTIGPGITRGLNPRLSLQLPPPRLTYR